MSIMNRQHRKEKKGRRAVSRSGDSLWSEARNEARMTRVYMAWLMHFGDTEPGKETCLDCVDYKIKVCAGEGRKGEKCLECMDRHSLNMAVAVN